MGRIIIIDKNCIVYDIKKGGFSDMSRLNFFIFFFSLILVLVLFCPKNIYAEYKAPQIILIEENFAEDQFPPEGWQRYQMSGTTVDWERTTNFPHSLPACAFMDYSQSGTELDNWLVSPKITEIQYLSVLSLYEKNKYMSDYGYHGIYISRGSGYPGDGDFLELAELYNISSLWTYRELSLSEFAGDDIYIAFVYRGEFASTWYIDDISVRYPDPGIYFSCEEIYLNVCTGSTVHTGLNISNYTSESLDLVFEAYSQNTYDISIEPGIVYNLEPGAQSSINIYVSVPEGPYGWTEAVEILAYAVQGENNHQIETISNIFITNIEGHSINITGRMHNIRVDSVPVVYDDKIYIFGGNRSVGGEIIPTVEIYDPINNIFELWNDIPGGMLQWAQSGVLYEDIMIINNAMGPYWTKYNFLTDSWSYIETPFDNCNGSRLTLLGDKIYFSGGFYDYPDGSWTITRRFWEYDIINDTWTRLPDLLKPLIWHIAFAYNDKIYLMGGWTGESFLYCPAANSWTNLGSLPLGDLWGNASYFDGQRLMIANGNLEFNIIDQVIFYYPELNVWALLQGPVFPVRNLRSSAVLFDNKFYIFGGFDVDDGYYPLNTVQIVENCMEDQPYQILLDNFDAIGVENSNQVNITWRTVEETNTIGFNLYRLIAGKIAPWFSFFPVRLNDNIIYSQGAMTEYSWTDYVRPGGDYFYILEPISYGGESERISCRIVW